MTRRLGLPLLLLLGAATQARAEAFIEFELVTQGGFSQTDSRKWVELFAPFDRTRVRVRSAQGNEAPHVENRGDEQSPRYHVVGILTDRNRLLLPASRSFGPRDTSEIRKWIERLRNQGASDLGKQRGAFGLTKEEFLEFHERLERPMDIDTRNRRAGDVARHVVQRLGIPFTVSPAARRAFAANEPVADELRGLSSGTVLAATLRPLGLALAPRQRSRKVELWIAASHEIQEAWPIGWPSDESPLRAAPDLFEYLEFDIQDYSLQETLDALQQRIKTPILLDHNQVAALRVDLKEKKVSFAKKRTFYKRVIDNVLFQAHLTSELRVDEAGRPFLWVRSTRQ